MYGSWVVLLGALCVWILFGVLVWWLGVERAKYAAALESAAQNKNQEQAASLLRNTMRDTEADRKALEAFMKVDVLTAAATVEAAGKSLGMPVTISGAVSKPLGTAEQNTDVSAVSFTVRAEGPRESLFELVRRFETLPFLSTFESVEINHALDEKGKDTSTLTVRLRMITTSPVGI